MLALVPTRSRPRSRAGVRAAGRRGGARNTQIPRRGTAISGARFYSPSQGRFLGRDPKMEQGGLNLYGFVTNNPINLWDYLGMSVGLTALQEQRTALNSQILALQDLVTRLSSVDDESSTIEANAVRTQIAELETQFSTLEAEISAYGGTYRVGSDGDTGLFIDRFGSNLAGPFAFNSPTTRVFDGAGGTTYSDPDTGRSWFTHTGSGAIQDMTGTFFGGASLLKNLANPTLTVPKITNFDRFSVSVREFLKGEKPLSKLTEAEVQNALRGLERAAEAAKTPVQKAFQEARAAALRGDGPLPGSLSEFAKEFAKKAGGGG